MKPIDKFLRQLPYWERQDLERTIVKLVSGKWEGLDIKKLKGVPGAFRARKGDIRIIYCLGKNGKVMIIEVGRRNDTTYSF